MWLPPSVHKYCRNLQMAALLPNSDHTASPNSMEMNYCRSYSAAHHVGLASAPSPFQELGMGEMAMLPTICHTYPLPLLPSHSGVPRRTGKWTFLSCGC